MVDFVTTYSTQISALLSERLRIKAASLERQVYKAGPKLPRRVRKAAKSVVEAQKIAQNPKLARMLDEVAFRKAAEQVIEHLETIDPWDVFKGKVLKWLGFVSFFLIVGFIAAVWFAQSRGMI